MLPYATLAIGPRVVEGSVSDLGEIYGLIEGEIQACASGGGELLKTPAQYLFVPPGEGICEPAAWSGRR